MLYVFLALTSLSIVALDQFTKYLTVTNIPLHGHVPFWDGLFHFTYLHNTGAAFSMLEGQMWFFYVLTTVFVLAAIWAVKKKWIDHPVGLFALAAVVGGAIGNLIDRATLGYVVDMIQLDFMDFAIFNVADCFIVVGAIVLCIWALFLDKKPTGGTK